MISALAISGAAARGKTLAVLAAVSTLALGCLGTDASAQAPRTDTITGSCVFSPGTAHCVRQFRYNDAGNTGIKHLGEPGTEVAEARDREKAWESRCRPALRQDHYGVNRYVYAAPGCEFGRTN